MSQHTGWLYYLKNGQQYMQEWPMRKELSPLFPEQRVIKTTRFGIRVMPAVATISILTQLAFQNDLGLPQAIVVALFALSLPLQGMWWLGHRSHSVLPPSLATWYHEIHSQILQTGTALEPIKSRPRYKELAKLLSRAYQVLDRYTLERWF